MTTYKQAEKMAEDLMALAYGPNWLTLEERVFNGYAAGLLVGSIDAGIPVNSRQYMDRVELVRRLSRTKATAPQP